MFLRISRHIPLSLGCLGPGERTILLGFSILISSSVIASFLTVFTSSFVSSLKYCSTLNTKES